MRRPPPWLIGLSITAAGLLVAGLAWSDEVSAMLPAGMWGKKPLNDKQTTWLRGLIADALGTITSAGLPANVAFAQAAIETGWGSAGRNNPWGQRGKGDAGSQQYTTTECFTAGSCEVLHDQTFAKYSTQTAAAQGYTRFLAGKSYRPGKAFLPADPGRWLLWLWAMGYGTANHYAGAVVDASRKIAVTLGDASYAIDWTDAHKAIADQLSEENAGSARRAKARELLGVG